MTQELKNRYSDSKEFSQMDLEQKILFRSANLKVPDGISAEEALALFNLKLPDIESQSSHLNGFSIRRLSLLVSSAAAVCLALAGIWFLMFGSPKKEVVADKGTHIDYRLPDGSQVTINAESRIVYNRIEFLKNRMVELEGEAFFDVVKGSPFRISTKHAEIKVLGTSFNVYSRDSLFKVSCISGKIAVKGENQSVEIVPGESAALRGKDLMSYQDDHIKSSTGWIKGEFYYENYPLNLIFKEIERQFNVKFAAGGMDQKYFTGSFTNNDLKNTLDVVCIPMGLNYEIGTDGKIFIREKEE